MFIYCSSECVKVDGKHKLTTSFSKIAANARRVALEVMTPWRTTAMAVADLRSDVSN